MCGHDLGRKNLAPSVPPFGMASQTAKANASIVSAQLEGDYAIKSEEKAPKLDTSQWPLLLKNYDKLLVRSSHFTPIPSGCSPLKRDIQSYIKYGLKNYSNYLIP